MPKQEYLFPEFLPITSEEWKAKIEKDLKGRSYDELQWAISNDINIAPYYTKQDRDKLNLVPLKKNKAGNDWEIAEDFIVNKDFKILSKDLLESLNGGINAPRFFLEKELSLEELSTLFHGVEFDYISVHFRLSDRVNYDLFYHNLNGFLSKNGKDISTIKGSVLGGDFQENTSLKTIGIDCNNFNGGINSIPEELAKSIKLGVDLIMASQKEKDINAIINSVFFSINIGKSYFPAIAKTRALRILWSRICDGFNIKNKPVEIEVGFNKNSFDENKNTNMIRSATMAMAAIIGGADRLIVSPADVSKKDSNNFSKRIARNVQHLLKMESFFDKVNDPSAGSYYIEKMTNVFVEQAWDIFLEKEKIYHNS